MHQDENDNLNIKQLCYAFSSQLTKLSPNTELYVIFGGSKAGKSITVDLLADKQLILYNDVEFETDVIVQAENFQQYYPPIYMISNQERIIMESFTLDENFKDTKTQLVKLIYLEEFIKVVGKVSFIIVFDSKMPKTISCLFEHFLRCFGITSQKIDNKTHILKDFIYIFITKTQPGDYEQIVDIIQQESKNHPNQNIAEIFKQIIYNQRIAQFPISDSPKDFGFRIKDKFSLKKNRIQLKQLLQDSYINQSISKQNYFSSQQIQNISDLFFKLVKIVCNLILFSCEQQKNYRKKYENLIRAIFSSHKRKNDISLMSEGWKLSQIIDLSFQIHDNVSQKQKIIFLFNVVIEVLIKLEQKSIKTKSDFSQLRGIIIFCVKIKQWLIDQRYQNQLKTILKDMQVIFWKIKAQKVQKLKKSPPKQPASIGRSNFKKKATPISIFKQQIMSVCRTNKDAINYCLAKINQKQSNVNYDYFQVIYHIKLIRDLIEQLNQVESGKFIGQLLQMSLYTDNFYNFNNYLRIGIKDKLIDQATIVQLIKILLQLKRTDQCLSLIKYAQGYSLNNNHFNRLTRLKLIVQKRNNEFFHNENLQNGKNITLNKRLAITMKKIEEKQIQSQKYCQFMQQASFQKYLSSLNE